MKNTTSRRIAICHGSVKVSLVLVELCLFVLEGRGHGCLTEGQKPCVGSISGWWSLLALSWF